MARTLLSGNDTLLYTAIHDCEKAPQSSSQRRGVEETKEDDLVDRTFRLYPNPNSGDFSVWMDMGEEDIAEIHIWSVSGQHVQTVALESGENRLELNVADGLYLYNATVNGSGKWSGKISVLSD
ncbi:MAG: T9SS type A sorting domain-containing protein [Flavobacteriales bacterium]